MFDGIDQRLIELIEFHAQQRNDELAKELDISTSTVKRRLKKLTQRGVLRIAAIIDPIKAGFPVTAVIALDVDYDKLESVMETLAKKREIRWLSNTTGRFDVIALAWFRSNDALFDFIRTNLTKMQGIRGSETFICLEVRKERYKQTPVESDEQQ